MVDLLSECQSFEMKLNRVEKSYLRPQALLTLPTRRYRHVKKLFRLTTWTMRKRLHCLTNMTGCY